MLDELALKVTSMVIDLWDLDIDDDMLGEDIESAIREAFVRGIVHGALNTELFLQAKTIVDNLDRETDNV